MPDIKDFGSHQYFLNAIPWMQRDENLVEKLKKYSAMQRPLGKEEQIDGLRLLGTGDIHTHYSVGRYGELFLATRESMVHQSDFDKRLDIEDQLHNAYRRQRRGEPISKIMGVVHSSKHNLYFILTEDHSAGGSQRLIDRGSYGGLIIKNMEDIGTEVHFSFHSDYLSSHVRYQWKGFEFTLEGNMLEI